jgi:hypothetical protein
VAALPGSARVLSIVAAVSGVYDVAVGLTLLVAPAAMASAFGVAPPEPAIFGTLNGLFLLAVGVGYWLPYRDPESYRGYLWVMGPLLKGTGALAFVIDRLVRHSPASFLLFAASDGALALVTLWALMRTPAVSRRSGRESRTAAPGR